MAASFFLKASVSTWQLIPLHLLAFFATCMVCHGELARRRPVARRLTEFYLWLSVGGTLGGFFNALAAPILFTPILEYAVALSIACALRPSGGSGRLDRALDLALPAGVALGVPALGWILGVAGMKLGPASSLTVVAAGIACYAFSRRPLRFGLSVGVLVAWGLYRPTPDVELLHAERSFFGIHRVAHSRAGFHLLYHGNTLHGAEGLASDRRRIPLTYYFPTGPVGTLFAAIQESKITRRVAVLGLGTGTIAAYARPGEEWTFYEIDPAVERIARNSEWFTFLSGCPAKVAVVPGDGRLSLAHAPDRHYGMIVIDVFSSDAIPVHFLTREAVRLYSSKLSERGIIFFNTSNRYLDLASVLVNLARDAGLACIVLKDDQIDPANFKTASEWIVLARPEAIPEAWKEDPRTQRAPAGSAGRVWTDDYSNILEVIVGGKGLID